MTGLRTRLLILEWMMGLAAIVTIALLVKWAAVSGMFAAPVPTTTLALGKISHDYPQQPVQVTNIGKAKTDVAVECGFFRGGELIGSGHAYIWALSPGDTGYESVGFPSRTVADHVECRIGDIRSVDNKSETEGEKPAKQETPR